MVKRKKMTAAQRKEMTAKRRATIAAKEAAAAEKVNEDLPGVEQVQPLPDDTNNEPTDDLTNPNIVDLPADAHPAPLQNIKEEEAAAYQPTMADLENNPLWPFLQKMQQEMEELKAANQNVTTDQKINQIAQMDGAQVGNNGVVGQKFKYPIDANYYPNPVEELYDDPTLRRFALRENFYISWEVTGAEYEKGGILFAEPRFEVAIYRYMYDEEGMPNGKMYLVGRNFLHEDEMFARLAAQRVGLVQGVDYEDTRELLNKIRLLRIQKWLRESFRPINIKGYAKKSTTMVIDGKQVEVFDTEDVVDKAKAEEEAATIEAQTRRTNTFSL